MLEFGRATAFTACVLGLLGLLSATGAAAGGACSSVRLDQEKDGPFNPSGSDGKPNPKYMAPLDQGTDGACWAFAGSELLNYYMLQHPPAGADAATLARLARHRTSPLPRYFDHCLHDLDDTCNSPPSAPGQPAKSHDVGGNVWDFLQPTGLGSDPASQARETAVGCDQFKLCSCSHETASSAVWQHMFDSQTLWACELAYVQNYDLGKIPRCMGNPKQGLATIDKSYFHAHNIDDATAIGKLGALVCEDAIAKGVDRALARIMGGTMTSLLASSRTAVARQLYPPTNQACDRVPEHYASNPQALSDVEKKYTDEVEVEHACQVSAKVLGSVCDQTNCQSVDTGNDQPLHVSSGIKVEPHPGGGKWDNTIVRGNKSTYRVTIDSAAPKRVLDLALTKGRPVGVGICMKLLHDKDYYPAEYTERDSTSSSALNLEKCGKDGDTGVHAVVIIGRELHNGKCRYLIRNSWGAECKSYKTGTGGVGRSGPDDCTDGTGNVWVGENDLKLNLLDATAMGANGEYGDLSPPARH